MVNVNELIIGQGATIAPSARISGFNGPNHLDSLIIKNKHIIIKINNLNMFAKYFLLFCRPTAKPDKTCSVRMV